MGLGSFFRALLGFDEADDESEAEQYVEHQRQHAKGKLAASRRLVSVVALKEELRLHLSENLKPLVEALRYEYSDRPSVNKAIGSQIVILDARPASDARMHGKYDKILRIKKSMGKGADLLCLFGPRDNYKKYPRGTYPGLQYFCIKEPDLDHREPDLPPEGTPTVEGPTLYNFADISMVIEAKIKGIVSSSVKL